MTDVFKSASKIVLLLIAVSACAATFTGILEADSFMVLASMVFGYYFGKSEKNDPKK